jgi:hypothetical protein
MDSFSLVDRLKALWLIIGVSIMTLWLIGAIPELLFLLTFFGSGATLGTSIWLLEK